MRLFSFATKICELTTKVACLVAKLRLYFLLISSPVTSNRKFIVNVRKCP